MRLRFDRAISIFQDEISLLTPAGVRKLALPPKVHMDGLLAGRLIVTINEDWKPQGADHILAQGSVVALDLKALEKHPDRPATHGCLCTHSPGVCPAGRNHQEPLTAHHSRTCAGTRLCLYPLDQAGEWTRKRLDIPENRTVEIVTTNESDDRFFLELTGFLDPSSLWLGRRGCRRP